MIQQENTTKTNAAQSPLFRRGRGEAILVIDNYDSFTYNLVHAIKKLSGLHVDVFRNDEITLEEIEKYDKIVLSPGPGIPEEAGLLLDIIKKFGPTKCILGVCLGHQAIGAYFGATLVKADKPMHGKISTITHNNDIPFEGLEEKLQVVRYHSLILKNVPAELKVTASTSTDEVMAIKHRALPIHGIQFHPEAILTEKGLQMLHNWARYYKLDN